MNQEQIEKLKQENEVRDKVLELMASTGNKKAKALQICSQVKDKMNNLLEDLIMKDDEQKVEFVVNNFSQINKMLDDITKALEDGTYQAK